MAEFSGVSFGVLLSFAVTLSRFTGTLEQTGAIFSIINNICAFYSQNVCREKYVYKDVCCPLLFYCYRGILLKISWFLIPILEFKKFFWVDFKILRYTLGSVSASVIDL